MRPFDPTAATEHLQRISVRTANVQALDEAEAVRVDRMLAAEAEEAGIDLSPVDNRLPEHEDGTWLLAEIARRAHARGKLDPHIATALRLIADAMGISTAALADAVQALLAREGTT